MCSYMTSLEVTTTPNDIRPSRLSNYAHNGGTRMQCILRLNTPRKRPGALLF